MLIIKYKHHGVEVSVGKYLKGNHKEYCLCYLCKSFKPKPEDDNSNCAIAKSLFKLDCLHHIVTPVWECPKFILKEDNI